MKEYDHIEYCNVGCKYEDRYGFCRHNFGMHTVPKDAICYSNPILAGISTYDPFMPIASYRENKINREYGFK